MRPRRFFTPWVFLAPALAVALIFHIFPFFRTIQLSFTDFRLASGGRYVGLENFGALASSEVFWLSAGNTLLYVLVVVPLLVVLPLLLALLVQPKMPGMSFFRASFYTPVIASMVVVGLIWVFLLKDQGPVNWLLQTLQVVQKPLPFLTDGTLLLLSCMLVTVWKGLGFYMVIYLTALANVPGELHEAAQVDGAGSIRRFWSVTVPSVRPTMLLVAVLSAIAAMKVYAEIFVIAGPTAGPGGTVRSIVFTIREVGSGFDGQVGYAAAMSLVLFVFAIGLTVALQKLSRERQEA
ncbi:sugar ABC transporter permease [Microbacterium sp. 4R-513]|uniref:carbohydrate ABC transporter permease n=1 Tax=Microbacterium sp. 4R-513 TaxID=2567934 RepID=UPI0013E14C4E|nr:sugar ABC transporter permease [Microbacterium sp. 4R-513]QIG40967.1 sugar ABC transporter permease [Microbacterium sp. 4R-513]